MTLRTCHGLSLLTGTWKIVGISAVAPKIVDDVGYRDMSILLYARTMKSSSFCSSSVNGTLIEVFENEISARNEFYLLISCVRCGHTHCVYLDAKNISSR